MTIPRRLMAAVVALSGSIGVASANECTAPPEAGTWIHPRPKAGEISRLEILHFCEPDRVFGQWKVRAHSRCSPRDCTWGWAAGQRQGRDGLYAGFQGFYGIRFVTMAIFADRMQVDVRVIYHDTKRDDESYVVILQRE